MSVFKDYSVYYDLLYKDKNYTAEAEYVDRLIRESDKDAITLLNLGCGTGKHDAMLEELGYNITGVDLSQDMIDIANSSTHKSSKINFLQGDIRTVRLKEKFDIVTSLFNVIGYQTSDEDFLAVLTTVKHHLKKTGLFVFDIWHSPAVLKQIPEVRIKRMSNEAVSITRLAEPVIHKKINVIDVNYEILIEDLKSHKLSRIIESHSVRHFSRAEISLFAKHCGFDIVRSEEFLSGEKPSENTWNVCYILKKTID